MYQGNECPLCNKKYFTTQSNKYFRDRVRSLDVFCEHKEKGCEWKGKVSELEHHMKTCPLRNTPSETPREIYNITFRQGFIQRGGGGGAPWDLPPPPKIDFTHK